MRPWLTAISGLRELVLLCGMAELRRMLKLRRVTELAGLC
jgi:hypothetical protein